MNNDITKLKTAINGLVSSYNAKPLDDAGMGMWLKALEGLPYQHVRAVIIKWVQTQKFMPRPSDIVQAVHQVRLSILEKKRQEAADADRRDRQENGESVDVEERIKDIKDTIGNPKAGTLRATHDAYGNPYSKEEIYTRLAINETCHLPAPKCYEERARKFLEAEKYGIHLSPMQISWAKKVLEIEE